MSDNSEKKFYAALILPVSILIIIVVFIGEFIIGISSIMPESGSRPDYSEGNKGNNPTSADSEENKKLNQLLAECDSIKKYDWQQDINYSKNTNEIFISLNWHEEVECLDLAAVKETYSDSCETVFNDDSYSDSAVYFCFRYPSKLYTNAISYSYQIENITSSYDNILFRSSPSDNITIDEIAENFPEISQLDAKYSKIINIENIRKFENLVYLSSYEISSEDVAEIEKILPDCMVENSKETYDLPFESNDVKEAADEVVKKYGDDWTLYYGNILYDGKTVLIRVKSTHDDFTFDDIYPLYEDLKQEFSENRKEQFGNSGYILDVSFEDNTPHFMNTVNKVEISCTSKGSHETKIFINNKGMKVTDFAREFPECSVLFLYPENMDSVDDLFGFYNLNRVKFYEDSERTITNEEKQAIKSSYFDCEVD